MNLNKLIGVVIIFILILPSISLNASSKLLEENNNSTRESFIHKLLRLRFNLGFLEKLTLGRYFTRQLRPPVAIQAYPASVNLRYLNETIFQIGGKNENQTEWVSMVKVAGSWDWAWLNTRIIFSFQFVPPENTSMDIWNVQFDPEYLIIDPNKENMNWTGWDTPFKTNVTIMLKPNVDPRIVTQDVILKVNIVREELLNKFGILSPPKYPIKYKDEYIEKVKEMGIRNPYWDTTYEILLYKLFVKYSVFLMNIGLPAYDKWIDSTVEILIKVDKYHLAEIKAPLPLEISPYQVRSIPVSIQNLGSHIDTYNFRVKCDEENMVVTPPPALTLKPGEEGQALLGVAAPREFLSVGSTTSIFVEAYSVEEPETIFSNTVILTRTGIRAPGGVIYNSSLFLIFLFIIVGLYLFLLNKRRDKICKKPDKPWEIPEEKEYLETLDEDEYKKIRKMMEDEYESAILWYKYYLQAIIKKKKTEEREKKIKEKEEAIKEKEKKIKEKTKKLELKKEIKKEKIVEPPKKEIKKEKIVETKIKETPKIQEKTPDEIMKEEEKSLKELEVEREKRRKEKIILKIKREQEEQKRRLA